MKAISARISEQPQLRESLRFNEHAGRYRLPDIEPMKFLLLCAAGIFAASCTPDAPQAPPAHREPPPLVAYPSGADKACDGQFWASGWGP